MLIFAIVSNSSITGLVNIEARFNELTCPLPLYDGVDYLNGTIVYDTGFGSDYRCTFDPLSAPPGTQISVTAKQYNATSFSAFPSGWFVFAADTITEIGIKIGAFFTLITYILTPINFNILGYTIADLSGFALMFVISIYIICYVVIAVFIYKSASPFSGVG